MRNFDPVAGSLYQEDEKEERRDFQPEYRGWLLFQDIIKSGGRGAEISHEKG